MRRILNFTAFTGLILGTTLIAGAQQSAPKATPAAAFVPVEQWKAAVIAGDAAKLRALYSANPPARVVQPAGEAGTETDVAFWIALKARRMKIDLVQSETPQPGLQQVAFQAEIISGASGKTQTVFVSTGSSGRSRVNSGGLWPPNAAHPANCSSRWILKTTSTFPD